MRWDQALILVERKWCIRTKPLLFVIVPLYTPTNRQTIQSNQLPVLDSMLGYDESIAGLESLKG
jgi:hypothetical protein